MRIAVLVKQVPRADTLTLLPDGRLRRHDVELEMNPYCRRAVTKGVELAAEHGGCCVVYSLGPDTAEAVVREAVAGGADAGVLVCDPAFAGSDTLATARALAAALRRDGPWDLVLTGRSSVDADTGQVGPQLAELLDLPFVGAVRHLQSSPTTLRVRCELDDGWRSATVRVPAVVSVAERLAEACKMPAAACAAVDAERLRTVTAAELGEGPWGLDASRTRVGATRAVTVARLGLRLSGPIDEQVAAAAAVLAGRDLLGGPARRGARPSDAAPLPAWRADRAASRLLVVVVEPHQPSATRELLGEAARLAQHADAEVVAVGAALGGVDRLAAWGADAAVQITGSAAEEDVAEALDRWCLQRRPWAALAPSTLWGREVLARLAVRRGAGLTGDVVAFDVAGGRLVGWKPAFGGRLQAAITATSELQLATVRPGMLPLRPPRLAPPSIPVDTLAGRTRGRVQVTGHERDASTVALRSAAAVVGVGRAVPPDAYPLLDPLLDVLGAELGATRKVTDNGWLPRSRQIGITGLSIAPALYVAVGAAGTFNHMVGVLQAGTIVVVNHDPAAPAFDWGDVGLVGDWRQLVPALADALATRHRPDAASAVPGAGWVHR